MLLAIILQRVFLGAMVSFLTAGNLVTTTMRRNPSMRLSLSSPTWSSPSSSYRRKILHCSATSSSSSGGGSSTSERNQSKSQQHIIQTRFVLVNTLHAGNVGASARAIKTMGFEELVLVNPKDIKVLNRQRTKEGASGAVDILTNAKIYNTLEEALQGSDIYCATGMPFDMYNERPFLTTQSSTSATSTTSSSALFVEPRKYFEQLLSSHTSSSLDEKDNESPQPSIITTNKSNDEDDDDNNSDNDNTSKTRIRISFVFGNEKYGLSEQDMMHTCHVILGIPTNPKFGSLNLASSVQLIAYDWRMAIGW